MKILNASKRSFGDWMGTALTTKDMTISTGYRGRGKQIEEKEFKVGTRIRFKLKSLNGGKCYMEVKPLGAEEFKVIVDLKGSLEDIEERWNLKEISEVKDYYKSKDSNRSWL